VFIDTTVGSGVPAARLKTATAVLDHEPPLDAATFALVRFAADYYHHPVGEAYAAALPQLLRAGRPLLATETRWRGVAGRADAARARLGAPAPARRCAASWPAAGWSPSRPRPSPRSRRRVRRPPVTH
jgi:primosomal protein N' (replication factor Y)